MIANRKTFAGWQATVEETIEKKNEALDNENNRDTINEERVEKLEQELEILEQLIELLDEYQNL